MGVEGLRNIEVHRACVEDINREPKAIMVRGKGTKGRMEPIYPCEETLELIEEYLKSIPTDHKIKNVADRLTKRYTSKLVPHD